MTLHPLLATADWSIAVTVTLAVLVIVAALVVMWAYGVSSLRKTTADLQEQANTAQEQIIEALQAKQAEMEVKVRDLETTNARQAQEILRLNEQVTNAAKVDALREDVSTGFQAILDRLPAVTG